MITAVENNLLEKVKQAQKRLDNIAIHTPLIANYNLSKRYSCNLLLKREDMQVVRSFKIRGAYNKISSLDLKTLSNGIVCASAGNHAQGVALSCYKLKINGLIFMPITTPKQKIAQVKHFGKEYVTVILEGDNFDESYDHAKKKAKEINAEFIHPFDDEKVIVGQATIAAEIFDDVSTEIDYLFVPIGGGGLAAGICSYASLISPKTKIIGVESKGAPAMYNSIEVGKLVTLEELDPFADGIAVKSVGQKTYKICKEYLSDVVLVPEGKICSSILELYNKEAIVVEPAAAIVFSALDQYIDQIKSKNVVIVVSGGNNDINRTQEIRERALLYEGLKHYFIIKFPQRAGALKEFLEVLGPNDDIAHFEYTKKNNRESGPALVGIELKNKTDYEALIKKMNAAKINFSEINKDPMLFEMLV